MNNALLFCPSHKQQPLALLLLPWLSPPILLQGTITVFRFMHLLKDDAVDFSCI
jgi:hypothetical protein